MPGLFVIMMITSLNSAAISNSRVSDFQYNWDACQQAGKAIRRQQPQVQQDLGSGVSVSFVCVPVINTVINVPTGAQQGARRPNFFPGDY